MGERKASVNMSASSLPAEKKNTQLPPINQARQQQIQILDSKKPNVSPKVSRATVLSPVIAQLEQQESRKQQQQSDKRKPNKVSPPPPFVN
jgi:uncharacterized protein involved in exopolysaccharide biosynthesis